jgi:L-lactate utilization protein LutC
MDKLEYILKELNNIKPFNKYVKKAVAERIEYYNETAHMLETVTMEQIEKFCFLAEALREAEKLEKLNFAPKLLDKVVKLETHENAPELNLLHFKKHFITVPQAKTIAEAITQIIQSNSISSLIKLNLSL